VKATSSSANVLATAFTGVAGERTVILLNRSAAPQTVEVRWAGARFRYLETVSTRRENAVEPAPRLAAAATVEVLVAAGAIITLTNVELGRAPEDLTRG